MSEYLLSFDSDKEAYSFYHLQRLFFRQILGEQGAFYEPFDWAEQAGRLNVFFKYRLVALSVLRGYPGLELTLGAITADLKDILNTENPGVQETEWASIVLLANYLDAIDAIEKAAPATQQADDTLPSGLFIDEDDLRRLSDILARYLHVLDGKTLTAGIAEGGTADGTPLGLFENLTQRMAAMDQRHALIFLAILILAFSPELWRAGNFVLRALLNHKLLVLMRESDEFLEELHYSEGREASAGFTLKGLFNFAGKRTLTARSLTLQSLTDRYQNYVDSLLTYHNGKLIVIIDELDKIDDPNEVKDVLKEVKGALFQKGCYYLISISEDCGKAFRGRLAEGRDIFESTFEDVISIRQMPPATARLMVQKRIETDDSTVSLSNAAVDVLTVFSGAIPREIVRHLRATVLKAKGQKSISPKVIGRNIFRGELRQWQAQLRTAPYPGEQLIILRDYCQEIQESLPRQVKVEWPDLDSEAVADGSTRSIGILLSRCLSLLDPRGQLRSEEIISDFHMAKDAEGLGRFRQLAEVQACLRLMIMNALMRRIWRDNKLDNDSATAGIECFRTVMQHPAIAEAMLKELVVEHLRLVYPESAASEAGPADEACRFRGRRSGGELMLTWPPLVPQVVCAANLSTVVSASHGAHSAPD